MYIFIRDPITNDEVIVESLTGYVGNAPVDKESLGAPLPEGSSISGEARLAVRRVVVGE